MSTSPLEYDPGKENKKLWAEFRKEISQRLDAIRPERIGTGENEWREPVYAWARNHMPDETHLVRRIAQREVDTQERVSSRRGNNLIRDYLHGRAPLSWALVGPLPIKVGDLRIRLDVATPKEAEDAARELTADAAQVYDEVVLLANGLNEIAREARRKGYLTIALIGDKPPHSQAEAA